MPIATTPQHHSYSMNLNELNNMDQVQFPNTNVGAQDHDYLIKAENTWDDLGLTMEEPLADPSTSLDFGDFDIDLLDKNLNDFCHGAMMEGLQTPEDEEQKPEQLLEDHKGDVAKIINKMVELERETQRVKLPDSEEDGAAAHKAFLLSHFLGDLGNNQDADDDTNVPEATNEPNNHSVDTKVKHHTPEDAPQEEGVKTSRSGRPLKRKRPSGDSEAELRLS